MMLQPRFASDDEVRVIRNIRNDGTYPGQPTGALLVRRGSVGYVRHIGVFLQDQLIYTVHFLQTGNRMVGCREVELIPADAPWIPNRFERGDRVTARQGLAMQGDCGGGGGRGRRDYRGPPRSGADSLSRPLRRTGVPGAGKRIG